MTILLFLYSIIKFALSLPIQSSADINIFFTQKI